MDEDEGEVVDDGSLDLEPIAEVECKGFGVGAVLARREAVI
jgi:hypothetical protein